MDHYTSSASGPTECKLDRRNSSTCNPGKYPDTVEDIRSSLYRKDKGFATLLIILLFATISAFGLEAYLKAQAEARMAARESLSRQAFYAAEGGLEWAKAELDQDPLFIGGSRKVGEGKIEVIVTIGEGGDWITSEAQYGLTRRKIQVFLQRDQGRWVMSQYQELHQS